MTDDQFDDHVKRARAGQRYAAAELHTELSQFAPDPHDQNAVDEWARLYVESAYATNGPFLVVGDPETVKDHLEILYDLLVDKGWFDSLAEARIYADALRRDGLIVVWSEGGSNGQGGEVYADIASRAPKFAKMSAVAPIRYMRGITDRAATFATSTEGKVAAAGLALLVLTVITVKAIRR